jgi:ribose transport system permease protein
MMRVIDNGINMFQIRYTDADGVPRLWRLDANWTFVIVGAVILIAVVLDQVVHVVQAARRIRGEARPSHAAHETSAKALPAASTDAPPATPSPPQT